MIGLVKKAADTTRSDYGEKTVVDTIPKSEAVLQFQDIVGLFFEFLYGKI
jgi:hypothetical protein